MAMKSIKTTNPGTIANVNNHSLDKWPLVFSEVVPLDTGNRKTILLDFICGQARCVLNLSSRFHTDVAFKWP